MTTELPTGALTTPTLIVDRFVTLSICETPESVEASRSTLNPLPSAVFIVIGREADGSAAFPAVSTSEVVATRLQTPSLSVGRSQPVATEDVTYEHDTLVSPTRDAVIVTVNPLVTPGTKIVGV
jgi:hypothetical protein